MYLDCQLAHEKARHLRAYSYSIISIVFALGGTVSSASPPLVVQLTVGAFEPLLPVPQSWPKVLQKLHVLSVLDPLVRTVLRFKHLGIALTHQSGQFGPCSLYPIGGRDRGIGSSWNVSTVNKKSEAYEKSPAERPSSKS